MDDILDFENILKNKSHLFDVIYTHLDLPKSTYLGTQITKKTIIEQNNLSSSDKTLLQKFVQFVTWLNTIKPETVNIPSYITCTVEYIEVAVLKVTLKNQSSNTGRLKLSLLNKVAKLFHTLIPYPIILLIEYDDKLAISLADKRINQADGSKLIVDNDYTSQWLSVTDLKQNEMEFLNDFTFSNVSKENSYELYQDLISMILELEKSYYTGSYLIRNRMRNNHSDNTEKYLKDRSRTKPEKIPFNHLSNKEKYILITKLSLLQSKLTKVRKKLKKEKQMNEKMLLNLKAKKVKEEIAAISSQLE
ncbi:methyl-accepting chemotaxis protein [Paraphotobacterium marinum]|uniref:Methyl-accepting chemotaxis protein n=2 Tax=Paraphotobacterium marinum TaxID=1755811 RepID=A0A220VFJ0_9GAMM|nr:methyl-accepting chemotaxis protein [Paraphotobacterium marinum]